MKLHVHRIRFMRHLNSAIHAITSYKDRVYCARQNGNIEVYSGGHLLRTFYGCPSDGIEGILVVDHELISFGLDGNLNLWDQDLGVIKTRSASFGGAVYAVVASPAHDILAVGCLDGFIRLFTPRLDYLSVLLHVTCRITSLSFHPSKPLLLVGGTDAKARLVHVDTGRVVAILALDTPSGDTVVWDCKILSDGTLVTADSLGKVAFWHHKTFTLITQFVCHDADVLALAISSDGTRVFSTGVDRKICQISKLESLKWVRSGSKRYHSHDVLALEYMQDKQFDCLVSGGVDTGLIIAGPTAEFDRMKLQRVGMVPQDTPCCFAPAQKIISCLLDDCIKFWRVGTILDDLPLDSCVDRQRIQHTPHKHLVTITFNSGSNFIHHAISLDCEWVVVCDSTSVRLFQMDEELKITSIKSEDLCAMKGAVQVAITPNKSYLIVATLQCEILVYDLQEQRTVHKFEVGKHQIRTLVVSDDSAYFVTGSINQKLNVYSLRDLGFVRKLSKFPAHTSLHFQPNTYNLVVPTVTNHIYIINITTNSLTPWSQQNTLAIPSRFLERKEHVKGVCFPSPQKLLIYAESYVHIVDLSQDLDRNSKWVLDHRYQSILAVGMMQDELCVVERPVLQVWSELPDAFRKKQYGK